MTSPSLNAPRNRSDETLYNIAVSYFAVSTEIKFCDVYTTTLIISSGDYFNLTPLAYRFAFVNDDVHYCS